MDSNFQGFSRIQNGCECECSQEHECNQEYDNDEEWSEWWCTRQLTFCCSDKSYACKEEHKCRSTSTRTRKNIMNVMCFLALLFISYFSLVILFSISEVNIHEINFSDAYVSRPILVKKHGPVTDTQHIEMTWSHHTNTLLLLETAVYHKQKIDFIEFDIIFCEKLGVPVIGHSAETTSNITLSAFLVHFVELVESTHNTRGNFNIGLKLDFKHEQSVMPAIKILKYNQMNIPLVFDNRNIMLNADILQGPAGRKPTVDPLLFLNHCRDSGIKNIVISIGWTTDWSIWTVVNMHAYTRQNIQDALSVVAVLHDQVPITFAVRGAIFANTNPRILLLLLQKGHTVTFWGDTGEKARQAIISFRYYDQVYCDVNGPSFYIIATVLAKALFWGILLVIFTFTLLREPWHTSGVCSTYIVYDNPKRYGRPLVCNTEASNYSCS